MATDPSVKLKNQLTSMVFDAHQNYAVPNNSRPWLALFFGGIVFSWPMQVLFAQPLIAIFCYLPLLGTFRTVWRNRIHPSPKGPLALQWYEWILLLALLNIFSHGSVGIFQNQVPLYQFKWLGVFLSSAWVYLYVSRFASVRELTKTLLTLGVIGLLLLAYWLFDSYVKTVLWQPSGFGLKQLDYIVMRNSNGEPWVANASIYAQQYRAVGLHSSYAITSTLVAVGLLAIFGLHVSGKFWRKFTIGALGFVALFIGGAMTALLMFALTFSVALVCTASSPKQGRWILFIQGLLVFISFLSTLIFAPMMATGGSAFELLASRIETLQTQFFILFNFSGQEISTRFGAINTSMPKLWWEGLSNLVRYFASNPLVALVGEGAVGVKQPAIPRGGDFALVDWGATFGLPLLAGLLFALSFASIKSIEVVFSRTQKADINALLVFAGSSLFFMLGGYCITTLYLTKPYCQ